MRDKLHQGLWLRRRALGGVLLLLISISSAWGQSCSLCYTQAASAPSRFVQALRSGILVLIFPPLLISLAITVAAYRKRDQFDADQDAEREARDEMEKPFR